MIKQENVMSVYEKIGGEHSSILIDVRAKEDYLQCHAKGAVNYPLDEIQSNPDGLKEAIANKMQVYFICHSGKRSMIAIEALGDLENVSVTSVTGGTQDWISANLPVEK